MPVTAISAAVTAYGAYQSQKSQADAKKALGQGKQAGIANINAGEEAAQNQFQTANARLDPYAQGGQAGYNDYLSSIGINGPDAQKAVEQRYLNDPIQNALMDRIQRGNSRAFTYTGMNNSGAATQSLTNAFLTNWSNYQKQLQGLGDQGFQAAGAQSGIDTHAGDTSFAAGQQRAAINMGWANAMANAAGTGANNLINSIGAGAKTYAALSGNKVA